MWEEQKQTNKQLFKIQPKTTDKDKNQLSTIMPATPTWQQDHEFEASMGKVRETLSQKQNINIRASGMA
jgi:hypothetical protein